MSLPHRQVTFRAQIWELHQEIRPRSIYRGTCWNWHPAWNIKVSKTDRLDTYLSPWTEGKLILESGAFLTDIMTTSRHVASPHPAYTDPELG